MFPGSVCHSSRSARRFFFHLGSLLFLTWPFLAISWTSTKTQKPFFCPNLTPINKKYLLKYFLSICSVNVAKRSTWDISFKYFQSYILWHSHDIEKTRQKKIQRISSPNLCFRMGTRNNNYIPVLLVDLVFCNCYWWRAERHTDQ